MLPKRSVVSSTVGRTRVCPHCKATILESAAVCPQCKHHLRFGVAAAAVSFGLSHWVAAALGTGSLARQLIQRARASGNFNKL